jgi:hypothetical protein
MGILATYITQPFFSGGFLLTPAAHFCSVFFVEVVF